MSGTMTRRGRPKGSGIDDRQRLDAIARLIASNPALKPTTAIRTLGVSDPSVIRRLRDKFNSVRTELISEIEKAASSTATSGGARKRSGTPRIQHSVTQHLTSESDGKHHASSTKTQRVRSIAAAAKTSSARISAVAEEAAHASTAQPQSARFATRAATTPSKPRDHAADDDGERLPARSALPTEATDMFTAFFSAGVAATNTLMAAHSNLANEFFRSPYMSLALRQQLAFSEWAVGLVPSFQTPSKTAT